MSKFRLGNFFWMCGCILIGLGMAACGAECEDSIQCNNNCYSYALNMSDPQIPLPIVGEIGGSPVPIPFGKDDIVIGAMADAKALGTVFTDTVDGNSIGADTICPPGTYKVALAMDLVDPLTDYHWYRQNPDGTWSGKSGSTDVTNLDASGNVITDPETADRNYISCLESTGYTDEKAAENAPNYNTFGGYYCVGAGSSEK